MPSSRSSASASASPASAMPGLCPQCGAPFAPWRAKRFCSEPCRLRAKNIRLGRLRRAEEADKSAAVWPPATTLPAPSKSAKNTQQYQSVPRPPPPYGPAPIWRKVNDVTWKLVRRGDPKGEPIAWAIKASAYGWQEAEGWYGRIDKALSFGPTTEARAKSAVEAALREEPIKPRKGEIVRQGTLGRKFRWFTRPPPRP